MKLKKKTALITGSSRGIGRAIALGFAKEGADLAVNYYTENESAKQVVQRAISMGRRAISLQADVGRIEEIQRLVEEAWRFLGRIDILVNNAGIVLASSFLDMTEEIWNRTLAVNLRGAFFCSQMVAKKMIDNKIKGKIINVSSANSFQVEINRSAYNTSKGGLDAVTLSMAAELGPYGINVNGIALDTLPARTLGPRNS